MAHNCCVNFCKNRYSPASQIKFYRIPSGNRVFQAERRQLWLDAIQKANGNTDNLNQHSRICGDHFISGEASPDPDMPDYVPSVFTSPKQRPNPKRKRVEWIYRFKKRRRRAANAGTENKSLSGQNSSEKCKSSASVPHENGFSEKEKVELQTEESSTKTICLRSSSKPNTVSPSLTESTGIPEPQQMSPVVVLKSVLLPAGGFRCDLCHQTLKDISEFINHYQLHHVQPPTVTDEPPETTEATGNGEEPATADAMETSETKDREAPAVEPPFIPKDEPSFPCNMCDRSFTTSQNLKRHKLLHVKDGRKCLKCGALFCRRHRHLLFQPRVEPMKEPKEDSVSEEEKKEEEVEEEKEKLVVVKKEEPLEPSPTTENNRPIKVEPIEAAETINKPQIAPLPQLQRHIPVICVLPLPRITQIVPKPLPLSLPLNIKTPVTSPNPPAIPPAPTGSNNSKLPTLDPNSPPEVHPQLPPSLELFSPQRLTSSLLEVKRNYDYILSKPKKLPDLVGKKPVEPFHFLPSQKQVSQVKREKVAYDIEIML